MSPRDVASEYLQRGRVMQLATLHDENQPRANSVYYVASDDMRSVYWLSETHRRHSIDIEKNARVGGAVVIKADLPVAGLQFEGEASEVVDREEQKYAVDRYNEKYGGSVAGLYERMVEGTNKHHLYRVTVQKLELFDEATFPGQDIIDIPL